MNKGELKSKLKFLVLHYDPELVIDQSSWDNAYNFYIGYSQCFNDIIKVPKNDMFSKDFILDETFNFLIKNQS
jgi:hypothetical protein